MSSTLMTDEVSAALAQFFYSGDGPSHATLTRCFTACGLADVDPYDPSTGMPNKQQRVLTVCTAARRRPGGVDDKLLEQLLTALRVGRIFHATDPLVMERVSALRSALTAKGAGLDDEGRLQRTNPGSDEESRWACQIAYATTLPWGWTCSVADILNSAGSTAMAAA